MTQKIIFFDREKPYLIFPAVSLFFQLRGDIRIEPTDFKSLSGTVLGEKEEAYILDIAPTQEGLESRRWVEFQRNNEGKIKLWTNKNGDDEKTCIPSILREGYRVSPSWQKIAYDIANEDLTTKQSARILRAYRARLSLDFNTDHKSSVNKLLLKMTNELITRTEDHEIDALAAFQIAADQKLEAMLGFWSNINLRNESFLAYPFHHIPLLALEEGKEMNSFLDLKKFIHKMRRKLSKNVSKFVLEYNCRGRIHYLLVSKDQISRHSYHDRMSTQYLRIKAANKLL